jgi:RNA polymerase sigma-70 factor (ECF subfamily)
MDHAGLAGLIARAKAGDEEAARELQQVEDDIRLIVRIRLPRALRSRFDSMDFVQSVWESFLSDEDRRHFEFKDSDQLRGYLVGMARNKVLEAHRRAQSHKYELAREESLYVRRGTQDVLREVASSDPTPSQDAVARDRVEKLVEAGNDPDAAEMIRLRLEGRSFEEIADRLGLHERTVRRKMEEIRERMKKDGERP